MLKNHFDLIIFDWDGTLADSIDWIVQSIQQAALGCHQPPPSAQAIKDIIGLSIEEAMQVLFPGLSVSARVEMSVYYGQHFFSRPSGPQDLFPGVRDMLVQLQQAGLALAVATGKKAAGLAKVIQATEVEGFFVTTRCADQTASKPNPLMIDEIVAELGVSKQRTLMVGDSVHDLQMALNAGVSAVAVSCGAHSAEVLKPYRPLHCLSAPTELLNIF